jgi:hypothetical protein
MTTPDDQIPAPLPWNAKIGCAVCGCQLVETITVYAGRRCASHPEQFDNEVVLKLRLQGLAGAADAYIRTWKPPKD